MVFSKVERHQHQNKVQTIQIEQCGKVEASAAEQYLCKMRCADVAEDVCVGIVEKYALQGVKQHHEQKIA